MSEKGKYEDLWEDYYRNRMRFSSYFIRHLVDYCPPGSRESFLDLGCGSGRLAQLAHRMGLDVRMCDIAHNALDPRVALEIGDRFTCCEAKDYPGPQADYVFCLDVMEHLPLWEIDATVETIHRLTRKYAFVNICHEPDVVRGKTLHLTVRTPEWWAGKFGDRFSLVRGYSFGDSTLRVLSPKEISKT